MEDITSLRKRIIQLRERLLNKNKIDGSVISQYNNLEIQFKKSFPQISFEYTPITYPSFFERFFDSDNHGFQRRNNPILNRLEYMISFFPDELNKNSLTINYTSIENFHQIINSLNIDNSIKQTINQNITQLQAEITKPKRNKQKIRELITGLLTYDLPKEILMWLIKISLGNS